MKENLVVLEGHRLLIASIASLLTDYDSVEAILKHPLLTQFENYYRNWHTISNSNETKSNINIGGSYDLFLKFIETNSPPYITSDIQSNIINTMQNNREVILHDAFFSNFADVITKVASISSIYEEARARAFKQGPLDSKVKYDANQRAKLSSPNGREILRVYLLKYFRKNSAVKYYQEGMEGFVSFLSHSFRFALINKRDIFDLYNEKNRQSFQDEFGVTLSSDEYLYPSTKRNNFGIVSIYDAIYQATVALFTHNSEIQYTVFQAVLELIAKGRIKELESESSIKLHIYDLNDNSTNDQDISNELRLNKPNKQNQITTKIRNGKEIIRSVFNYIISGKSITDNYLDILKDCINIEQYTRNGPTLPVFPSDPNKIFNNMAPHVLYDDDPVDSASSLNGMRNIIQVDTILRGVSASIQLFNLLKKNGYNPFLDFNIQSFINTKQKVHIATAEDILALPKTEQDDYYLRGTFLKHLEGTLIFTEKGTIADGYGSTNNHDYNITQNIELAENQGTLYNPHYAVRPSAKNTITPDQGFSGVQMVINSIAGVPLNPDRYVLDPNNPKINNITPSNISAYKQGINYNQYYQSNRGLYKALIANELPKEQSINIWTLPLDGIRFRANTLYFNSAASDLGSTIAVFEGEYCGLNTYTDNDLLEGKYLIVTDDNDCYFSVEQVLTRYNPTIEYARISLSDIRGDGKTTLLDLLPIEISEDSPIEFKHCFTFSNITPIELLHVLSKRSSFSEDSSTQIPNSLIPTLFEFCASIIEISKIQLFLIEFLRSVAIYCTAQIKRKHKETFNNICNLIWDNVENVCSGENVSQQWEGLSYFKQLYNHYENSGALSNLRGVEDARNSAIYFSFQEDIDKQLATDLNSTGFYSSTSHYAETVKSLMSSHIDLSALNNVLNEDYFKSLIKENANVNLMSGTPKSNDIYTEHQNSKLFSLIMSDNYLEIEPEPKYTSNTNLNNLIGGYEPKFNEFLSILRKTGEHLTPSERIVYLHTFLHSIIESTTQIRDSLSGLFPTHKRLLVFTQVLDLNFSISDNLYKLSEGETVSPNISTNKEKLNEDLTELTQYLVKETYKKYLRFIDPLTDEIKALREEFTSSFADVTLTSQTNLDLIKSYTKFNRTIIGDQEQANIARDLNSHFAKDEATNLLMHSLQYIRLPEFVLDLENGEQVLGELYFTASGQLLHISNGQIRVARIPYNSETFKGILSYLISTYKG